MRTPYSPSGRRIALKAVAALCALAAAGAAVAQQAAWPAKPVRLVVGFPAGGTTDVMARVIAAPLQKALGQPVIVDNKPGASGNLAVSEVSRAPGDGYTLMVAPISVQTANPHLFKPALNPEKDLQPVASLGYAQLYLVARKDLPVKSAMDLVQMAKAAPGKMTYGSGGPGTQMHLVGELFKQQADIDVVHVPYRGAAPALQDLLGGQIDFYFDPGIGLGQVRAGKLKLLAVGSPKRSPLFPDVPTLHEAGLTGFDSDTVFGFYAPAGTPPEAIARLNREINRILGTKPVQDRITALGGEALPLTPAEFGAKAGEDSRRFGAIIRERKITGD
jgi:tripartite-type tricarboxylate transporter receptor subunit TctC